MNTARTELVVIAGDKAWQFSPDPCSILTHSQDACALNHKINNAVYGGAREGEGQQGGGLRQGEGVGAADPAAERSQGEGVSNVVPCTALTAKLTWECARTCQHAPRAGGICVQY